MAGSLWAASMGLLQLIVSFLTFIMNALTGVFSGGDQSDSSSSSGGWQTQRRYDNKLSPNLYSVFITINEVAEWPSG